MKNRIRKLLIGVFTLLLALPLPVAEVFAEVPYKTYMVDGYGRILETQTAYTPVQAITRVGEVSFETPRDLTISKEGLLYIADSSKKVILVSDKEGNLIQTIGEGVLVSPTGVSVTKDNTIYVADQGAQKIFVFNKKGKLIKEYGRPDSPIYGEKQSFKPTKITVNNGGNMYVICEGNTNGIVQISPSNEGSFLGYFGTNYTFLNPLQMIQRIILNDAQRAKLLGNIPSTPTNFCIDDNGLIYTVTQGNKSYTLKKLNIAGTNLLGEDDYYADLPVAVTTGNYDNVFVADNDGYVYEYNSEGELLFVFGGRDDGRYRIGLCSKVEAIAVDEEDNIYLLDSDKRQIHIFRPTEFTDNLHNALYLYSKGRYTKSKEPLTEVLTMNSLFDYANKAMGRAYLQEENYEEALRYARLSKDYDGYSDAFWEIRNLWLQENLVTAFLLLVGIFVGIKILRMIQRKYHVFQPVLSKVHQVGQIKLVTQVRYGTYFMKHPIDGCYGVRKEGKNSYLCANLLLSAFVIIWIINKYYCGFLFRTVVEGRYNLVSDIGGILIVFFSIVICNYLVVTINEGEGSFRQVYCGFAYCFVPFLLLKPFVIIISNVITYNEQFIVKFLNLFIVAWMLVLLFVMIKEINNYSVLQTIKIILLTLFTLLIMALVVFIIYMLFTQVINFVVTLIREVVYRFE